MRKRKNTKKQDSFFLHTFLAIRKQITELWTSEEFRCNRCGVDLSKGNHADYCIYSELEAEENASASDYIHSVGTYSSIKPRYPIW